MGFSSWFFLTLGYTAFYTWDDLDIHKENHPKIVDPNGTNGMI
jgi:hypothetical protein